MKENRSLNYFWILKKRRKNWPIGIGQFTSITGKLNLKQKEAEAEAHLQLCTYSTLWAEPKFISQAKDAHNHCNGVDKTRHGFSGKNGTLLSNKCNNQIVKMPRARSRGSSV